MSWDMVRDPVMQVLERGLDYSMVRQRILAQNVANVETPHYRRKDVDFQNVFRDVLQRGEALPLSVTHRAHFQDQAENSQEARVLEEEYVVRQDRSGVDVEKEMVTVVENALYYQALARMVSDKLGLLRTVIREVR
uniref:Flagellar basal body rod protein FlgB n=1 Tax=Candidatus Caldatribacterium californiense TaxID=1454726 RepID=A0A7V3YLG2_9BACT